MQVLPVERFPGLHDCRLRAVYSEVVGLALITMATAGITALFLVAAYVMACYSLYYTLVIGHIAGLVIAGGNLCLMQYLSRSFRIFVHECCGRFSQSTDPVPLVEPLPEQPPLLQ